MDRIGRYRLTQRIGAGSFATVYKGHDDELDVAVAVKVLADNWSTNEDVRQRFLGEARLLRKVHDERIVRVYDIGVSQEGRPYFVMDYCDAGSLEDYRKNLLPPGRALRLCAEAARALEVLHRHGVIHRDVTPGNILLAHSPVGLRVQLADLGVAKLMIDQQGGTMTAGTPAYMALEQATGKLLDQRADIYSIACVTYALLTGKPPFQVKTLQELLTRDQSIGPALIADRIGAPSALDALFASALSPYPGQRPQTAFEFASHLDSIADVLPGGDTYIPKPLAAAPTSIDRRTKPPIVDSFGQSVTSMAPTPPPPSGFQANNAKFQGSAEPGNVPVAPAPAMPASTARTQRADSGYRAPQKKFVTVAPRNETPTSMLDNYLGPGRYRVAKPKEKHSLGFYLGVGATGLIVFLLVLWVVITQLG